MTYPLVFFGALRHLLPHYLLICFVLLVLPIPLTIAWVTTKLYEKEADATHCGIGYSLLPSYWILEGPRIACIMVIIFTLLLYF